MYPMGFYDYGCGLDYGLGYGMCPSIPAPATVNHQADANTYLSHHSEKGIDPTAALLTFVALGSLAGLLIARKINKGNKLVEKIEGDAKIITEATNTKLQSKK